MTTASEPAIEKPQYWRLLLDIEADTLHALATSTVADATMQCFSIPLNPTLTPQAALREAVYSTPVLLSDFGRIDIVIASDRFAVLPAAIDTETADAAAEIAAIAAGGSDATVNISPARGSGAAVAWTTTPELLAFVQRTFRNPGIHHPLAILGSYFSSRSHRGNRRKTYIHLADGDRVDMASFDSDGSLLRLSAKHAASETDALYIIMASLKADCFNPLDDELLLCGNARRRQSLTPLLRRYIRNVMPMIFPSAALRAGDHAQSAPFPLVILPLCE